MCSCPQTLKWGVGGLLLLIASNPTHGCTTGPAKGENGVWDPICSSRVSLEGCTFRCNWGYASKTKISAMCMADGSYQLSASASCNPICTSQYCKNGGQCHISPYNGPICVCPEAYSGPRCDFHEGHACFNPDDSCAPHGQCMTDENDLPGCQCTSGQFSGDSCDEFSPCTDQADNPFCTGTTSSCVANQDGIPECTCVGGRSGRRCEFTSASPCATSSSQCMHGTCDTAGTTSFCNCGIGYSGQFCNRPVSFLRSRKILSETNSMPKCKSYLGTAFADCTNLFDKGVLTSWNLTAEVTEDTIEDYCKQGGCAEKLVSRRKDLISQCGKDLGTSILTAYTTLCVFGTAATRNESPKVPTAPVPEPPTNGTQPTPSAPQPGQPTPPSPTPSPTPTPASKAVVVRATPTRTPTFENGSAPASPVAPVVAGPVVGVGSYTTAGQPGTVLCGEAIHLYNEAGVKPEGPSTMSLFEEVNAFTYDHNRPITDRLTKYWREVYCSGCGRNTAKSRLLMGSTLREKPGSNFPGDTPAVALHAYTLVHRQNWLCLQHNGDLCTVKYLRLLPMLKAKGYLAASKDRAWMNSVCRDQCFFASHLTYHSLMPHTPHLIPDQRSQDLRAARTMAGSFCQRSEGGEYCFTLLATAMGSGRVLNKITPSCDQLKSVLTGNECCVATFLEAWSVVFGGQFGFNAEMAKCGIPSSARPCKKVDNNPGKLKMRLTMPSNVSTVTTPLVSAMGEDISNFLGLPPGSVGVKQDFAAQAAAGPDPVSLGSGRIKQLFEVELKELTPNENKAALSALHAAASDIYYPTVGGLQMGLATPTLWAAAVQMGIFPAFLRSDKPVPPQDVFGEGSGTPRARQEDPSVEVLDSSKPGHTFLILIIVGVAVVILIAVGTYCWRKQRRLSTEEEERGENDETTHVVTGKPVAGFEQAFPDGALDPNMMTENHRVYFTSDKPPEWAEGAEEHMGMGERVQDSYQGGYNEEGAYDNSYEGGQGGGDYGEYGYEEEGYGSGAPYQDDYQGQGGQGSYYDGTQQGYDNNYQHDQGDYQQDYYSQSRY